MKLLLCLFALVSAALAAPGNYEPIQLYYHESVGIAKAARLKAAEEAFDFDGARIAGGSAARLGQFPYVGGLVITLRSGLTSMCGSSLISNTRLSTAAHCWFDGRNSARQLTVVLGSTRLFTGGTRVTTSRVAVHANYNPRTLANDVGIITINSISFNNNIRSVGLASGTNTFAGQNAQAAGFGSTGSVTGQLIPVLNHVTLPVITNAECQRTFGSTIIASTICTSGANGRSTCSGDSGGPLVVGNSMIGITSFGSAAGCTRGFPAGFARVSSFNDWFRQRM